MCAICDRLHRYALPLLCVLLACVYVFLIGLFSQYIYLTCICAQFRPLNEGPLTKVVRLRSCTAVTVAQDEPTECGHRATFSGQDKKMKCLECGTKGIRSLCVECGNDAGLCSFITTGRACEFYHGLKYCQVHACHIRDRVFKMGGVLEIK